MPPKGTKQKTIITIYGCTHERRTRVQAYTSSITRVAQSGPCSNSYCYNSYYSGWTCECETTNRRTFYCTNCGNFFN